MWAVVEIGSKQYKVKEADEIEVQRLSQSPGSKTTLDKVLLFAKDDEVSVGKPYLKNVKVEAQVLGERKAKKTIIFKFKRRKGYQRKRGHRQIFTLLKILEIEGK